MKKTLIKLTHYKTHLLFDEIPSIGYLFMAENVRTTSRWKVGRKGGRTTPTLYPSGFGGGIMIIRIIVPPVTKALG